MKLIKAKDCTVHCNKFSCVGKCDCGCRHKADPEAIEYWMRVIARHELNLRVDLSNDIEALADQHMKKGTKSWQWALATSAAICRGDV